MRVKQLEVVLPKANVNNMLQYWQFIFKKLLHFPFHNKPD